MAGWTGVAEAGVRVSSRRGDAAQSGRCLRPAIGALERATRAVIPHLSALVVAVRWLTIVPVVQSFCRTKRRLPR